MTSANIEQLEQQIEAAIRDHIAEVRRRASLAMERAFASSVVRSKRVRGTKRVPVVHGEVRRRGAEELSELEERLYAAVSAHSGETMSTLAAIVGVPPRELNRPAKALKNAGRMRSIGERNMTRYFPMPAKSKAA